VNGSRNRYWQLFRMTGHKSGYLISDESLQRTQTRPMCLMMCPVAQDRGPVQFLVRLAGSIN
jgi:hypothetical protein